MARRRGRGEGARMRFADMREERGALAVGIGRELLARDGRRRVVPMPGSRGGSGAPSVAPLGQRPMSLAPSCSAVSPVPRASRASVARKAATCWRSRRKDEKAPVASPVGTGQRRPAFLVRVSQDEFAHARVRAGTAEHGLRRAVAIAEVLVLAQRPVQRFAQIDRDLGEAVGPGTATLAGHRRLEGPQGTRPHDDQRMGLGVWRAAGFPERDVTIAEHVGAGEAIPWRNSSGKPSRPWGVEPLEAGP